MNQTTFNKINKTRFYRDKNFIKWCKNSSLILVLGTSMILNIIYIPKYFNNHSNTNQQITTINIRAYNATDKSVAAICINNLTYLTNFNTLGDLISNDTKNFQVTSSGFGRMIIGVKDKNNNVISSTKTDYWKITDDKGIPSTVGIDLIFLKQDTNFRLELTRSHKLL